MPALSNYPGGFAYGVTIRGIPLLQTHPGRVFYVGNGTALNLNAHAGSDGNRGTFNDPFATLAFALTQCLADRGDIIFLLPGHAETISTATALSLNVNGVAIIGLGTGNKRPTFTLDTGNTVKIPVAANNVSVQNCIFAAKFLNIATCFNVANAQVATDFTVDNCEFRDVSAILNFVACIKVGTTANIADGLAFTNNKVLGQASTPGAGTTAIVLASDTKRLVINDNFIVHEVLLADTPSLLQGGALNHTELLIARNKSFRPNTSTTGGNLIGSSSTACSGIVCDNYDGHLDNSAGLMIATGTKLAFFRNFSMITGAADKSALENPVAV